jgi:hypothetical protein
MFSFIVNTHYIIDQIRMTWRHNFVMNHIAGCLMSALMGQSTIEVYFELEGLQALGGGPKWVT